MIIKQAACAVVKKTPVFQSLTNDGLSERALLQRCQTQISNLHHPRSSGDENIVTLQVSVNDGWRTGMEEEQPFQDLSAPALDDLHVDFSVEALQIPLRWSWKSSQEEGVRERRETKEK
jgi:hypothetical protein